MFPNGNLLNVRSPASAVVHEGGVHEEDVAGARCSTYVQLPRWLHAVESWRRQLLYWLYPGRGWGTPQRTEHIAAHSAAHSVRQYRPTP